MHSCGYAIPFPEAAETNSWATCGCSTNVFSIICEQPRRPESTPVLRGPSRPRDSHHTPLSGSTTDSIQHGDVICKAAESTQVTGSRRVKDVFCYSRRSKTVFSKATGAQPEPRSCRIMHGSGSKSNLFDR